MNEDGAGSTVSDPENDWLDTVEARAIVFRKLGRQVSRKTIGDWLRKYADAEMFGGRLYGKRQMFLDYMGRGGDVHKRNQSAGSGSGGGGFGFDIPQT